MGTPRTVAAIQAEIAELQKGIAQGTTQRPWYGRYGFNRPRSTLSSLWPNAAGYHQQGTRGQLNSAATDLQGQLAPLQAELKASQEYFAPGQTAIRGYNTAYTEAKQANETRYSEMLGIADKTTDQRAADIRTSYTGANAGAQQGLARVGLANTTVAPTMKTGYLREQNDALDRNADTQQQTKLGIMERRTDSYPDQAGLLSLLQSYGYSGGLTGMKW